MSVKKQLPDWVIRAKAKHGDRYEYLDLVPGTYPKLKVRCRAHGEFLVDAGLHTGPRKPGDCPSCAAAARTVAKTKSFSEWVSEFEAKHGTKYQYTEVLTKAGEAWVSAVCLDHGAFKQRASQHKTYGCSACGHAGRGLQRRTTFLEAVGRSIKKHGDAYTYVALEHMAPSPMLTAVCSVHGEFTTSLLNHTGRGSGCRACAHGGFGNQHTRAIQEHLERLGVTASEEVRLWPTSQHRWDVVCQRERLAIEFDGVYWHSEAYKPRTHMASKAALSSESGYRQINIWEDEWHNKQRIVLRMLENAAGVSSDLKVSARDTAIHAVSPTQAKTFADSYHIQGFTSAAEHWGLWLAGDIVALMSVTNKAPGRSSTFSEESLEIQRYCTSANVRGGFQKLLKHVCKRPRLKRVTTFSDPRHFTGAIYQQAGFTAVHTYGPDYQYTKGGLRYSKRSRQKSWFLAESLKPGSKVLFDPSLTENELANLNGYYRLWDRGRVRWELQVTQL